MLKPLKTIHIFYIISLGNPGLMHGERLPIEMRGKRAPVVPIEALQKWKARPVEEVLAEYAEYMAENNE